MNQLAEAMQAKKDRVALSRASQSMGDVTVVKIMFRRVTSLLEVFQVSRSRLAAADKC